MTTVKRDDDSQNIYTVPVGRCFEQISVNEFNYEEKRKNALFGTGESISKNEPINISEKKTMRSYIVPGEPALLYQQGNQNPCILSSLSSVLHYMGDAYASEYIIRHKKKCRLEIHNKGPMHF